MSAQELVDCFAALANHEIGPIEAVLVNAVQTLRVCFQPSRYDEETITAALLGALAGGLPWVAETIGTRGAATDVKWGHYRKGSLPAGTHDDTERTHGADFALALRVAPDLVRVALFQAKRNSSDNSGIKVFRGQRGVASSQQFVAFRDTGLKLLRAVRPTQATFAHLHWIHYLAYRDGGPICVSLGRMTKAEQKLATITVDGEFTETIPADAPKLLDLLLRAVYDAECEPDGWLDLTKVEADQYLPDLQSLLPVYVADEGRGGNGLALKLVLIQASVASKPAPKPTPTPTSTSRPRP